MLRGIVRHDCFYFTSLPIECDAWVVYSMTLVVPALYCLSVDCDSALCLRLLLLLVWWMTMAVGAVTRDLYKCKTYSSVSFAVEIHSNLLQRQHHRDRHCSAKIHTLSIVVPILLPPVYLIALTVWICDCVHWNKTYTHIHEKSVNKRRERQKLR